MVAFIIGLPVLWYVIGILDFHVINDGDDERIILPASFDYGYFAILWEIDGAKELKKENGELQMLIPDNRVLVTSSSLNTGWKTLSLFQNSKEGDLEEIPLELVGRISDHIGEEERIARGGVTSSRNGSPPAVWYFVGTREEIASEKPDFWDWIDPIIEELQIEDHLTRKSSRSTIPNKSSYSTPGSEPSLRE